MSFAVGTLAPVAGRPAFMETAAGVIPLLFIALILERRLLQAFPAGFLSGRTKWIAELVEALLAVIVAMVLALGEWVALASLERPRIAPGDESAVGTTIAVGALLLIFPVLFGRALELAPTRWTRDSRLTFAAVFVGLAYAVGAAAIKLLL